VHTENPAAPGTEPVDHEKFDHMAEELLDFVDKHFPQVSETIAAQASSQDAKVFVNQKTGATVNADATVGLSKIFGPALPLQSDAVTVNAFVKGTTMENATLNSAIVDNAPITPEASGGWKVFRFLLALGIVAALVYFVLHR
jgi:hypothetical protein